jgi:hypothetical protein
MSQPSPFDALLVQSRDLFRDRICAALGTMFDGCDEALGKLAEKAEEAEQRRYLDARDLATNNREVVEKQFRTRLNSEFQKRTNQAKKIGQSLSDISLEDMELVGDDDLNETLKFNDLAARVRHAAGQRGRERQAKPESAHPSSDARCFVHCLIRHGILAFHDRKHWHFSLSKSDAIRLNATGRGPFSAHHHGLRPGVGYLPARGVLEAVAPAGQPSHGAAIMVSHPVEVGRPCGIEDRGSAAAPCSR